MATSLNNLSEYDPNQIPDSTEMAFGIVVAEWNPEITNSLLKACCETLTKHGTDPAAIKVVRVPGTFELPKACEWMADAEWEDPEKGFFTPNAVIAIGCVITGETKHDEYISHAVSEGIMNLNLAYDIPFIFGVLTPRNQEQALDRAGGKHGNKGVEAAIAAIKMVALAKSMNVFFNPNEFDEWLGEQSTEELTGSTDFEFDED